VVRLVIGVGCLVLALTPVQLLRSQSALDDAADAFAARDCVTAIDHALDSLSAVRARAEPYLLLGYCDVRLGLGDLAVRNFEQATDRDPNAWQAWYGLALAQAAAGRDPRRAARRALDLAPLEPFAQRAVEAFATSKRGAWRRRALRLPIPRH
jgi:Flp pilus assembly protein TadD